MVQVCPQCPRAPGLPPTCLPPLGEVRIPYREGKNQESECRDAWRNFAGNHHRLQAVIAHPPLPLRPAPAAARTSSPWRDTAR
jgi:hypothetical protein